MNTTLLIMAAGIGSRFGTGIKQLEPVDASNHIIMDYSIHDAIKAGFKEFFEKEVPGNPLKAEYLIPTFIGELLKQSKMSVKVLKTNDTWYGMTYKEDVKSVKNSFKKMLKNGLYKDDLFNDL